MIENMVEMCYEDRVEIRVEILYRCPEGGGIPKLKVQYFKEKYVPSTTEGEGKFMVQSIDGSPCWETRTIMNFRRYGWSATRRPEGLFGYGLGSKIWANGVDGGVPCDSAEDVIKTSLSAHVADLQLPDHVRYNEEFRKGLKVLLEDALKNEKALEWAQRAVK